MRAFGMGGVCAVLTMAATSGCAPSQREPPCFPPKFSVNPGVAKVGDELTISAPDAPCNPRYGANALVDVDIKDAAGTKLVEKTAPMSDKGGFTFTFVLPPGTAPGEATVIAMPHNIDWCDDTGRNNRVSANATLQRASCAVPEKSFTVTP